MMRMLSLLFGAAMLLAGAAGPVHANPIHSANGLGLTIPDDAGIAMGMGGAGVADIHSRNLIYSNPALLAGVKNHSFAIGAIYRRNQVFYGGAENPTDDSFDPVLFQLSLPVWRGIVFGWRLAPLTYTNSAIGFDGDTWTDRVEVTGGINRSSLALAATVFTRLHIGISYDYNFGMIEEDWERTFVSSSDLQGLYTQIKNMYRGDSVTLGGVLSLPRNISIGGGYTTESGLEETIDVRPGSLSNPEQRFGSGSGAVPSSWRAGIAAGIGPRFTAALDYTSAAWSDAARTPGQKALFVDSYAISGGVRYTPDEDQESFYLRFPAALGVYVRRLSDRSYPILEPVMERAVTAGLEFPLGGDLGSVVTALEYGLRGDKGDNGWEETYIRAAVTLIGTIK